MNGAAPTYDQLLDQNRRQARLIEELRAEVERLKTELEQARRAGKRQAAPFSKGPPKADPKRPGRKRHPSPRGRPKPTPSDRGASRDIPPATAPPRRRSRSIAPSWSPCQRTAPRVTPRSMRPRSPSTISTRSTCPSP